MYSFSLISTTDPPTSLFERCTAIMIVLDRQVVREQFLGLEDDLIFLDEPADRRHLRHARHGRELIAQIPILKSAQTRQILVR